MKSWWIGTISVLSVGGAAWGQTPNQANVNNERFERQLEQLQRDQRVTVNRELPLGERALLDYGGYVSFNFLSIDDPGQKTHLLRQYDLVGYGRINLDNVHEFFARARTSYYDWNDGDSFSRHGDDWVQPTLERGYYRFDLQKALASYGGKTVDYNVAVEAGRDLIVWGNGLTLSEEIDGGQVTLSYDKLDLNLIAGVTRRSVTDFDSSRPGFVGDTQRGFFGGLLAAQLGTHRPYVYGLVQRDYNDSTLELEGSTTRFDYDSYYLGVGSTGGFTDNLLYGVELVYEGGHGLSNSFIPPFTPVEQTTEQIQAMALDARLDYLLADPGRTRFSVEMILASGDPDRGVTSNTLGGNRQGTRDHAFNAFGLLNTGLAFSPSVSNLMMLRVGASTYPLTNSGPFKTLQVGLDGFVFGKLQQDGPIEEPTRDHHYLGVETDVFVNWQITSDVSLTARYGVFFPGAGIDADHDERHFFLTSLTYAF